MANNSERIYTVFIRNWWKRNPAFPRGLEPDPLARKTTLRRGLTEEEARQYCNEWNATHEPGRLSRKAEFTSRQGGNDERINDDEIRPL